MLSDLTGILQDECHLERGLPILVGVSGGADSLCLAEVLGENGYQVIVAHFDHKLRPESGVEAEIVRSYARGRGWQFISGTQDVQARVEKERESVEEAARNARYQFLFQQAEEVLAQGVAVGHTADDQVETVLMHLLRGSGLNGLSGMSYRWVPNAWHAEIPLVRPLLGVWREEVLLYCTERGLQPIEDPSNQDPAYFRNRLRRELIPYLETFNPAVRKLIWRSAQVLNGDRELIARQVDQAWKGVIHTDGSGYVAIDSHLAREYSLGMQRHLIRRAVARLRPVLRDIGFEAVMMAVEQLKAARPSGEVDFIAGLKLVSEPGLLWIAEWDADLPPGAWPQVSCDQEFLAIGSTLRLQSGWQLSAQLLGQKAVPIQNIDGEADVNQAWLDSEKVELPLLVRARREGDRFLPHGMDGHSQKLADFMVDHKIPRRARNGWPLVCSGDQIAWVAGYRSAHPFRVTSQTSQVVKLSLSHRDDPQRES